VSPLQHLPGAEGAVRGGCMGMEVDQHNLYTYTPGQYDPGRIFQGNPAMVTAEVPGTP
jgi:hypothetical protein